MSSITAVLGLVSLTVLLAFCKAQELSQDAVSRDKRASDGFDWLRDTSSYLSQQPEKRGFGNLKFGKRPFGSIKFGKRVLEPSLYRDEDFMQGGMEDNNQLLPDPSKRYSDMLDNLYFQSLIKNLKTPDDLIWNKRMAVGTIGDKRAKIKFGKKSFGPVANSLMTDKERDPKQTLNSKFEKSPYAPF